ncbi:MAG: lysostaphin resistance A-like protein, partial [Bryobacteraceae bacterium]
NERYGFIPDSRECRIGIESYLLFLPAGGAVAYLLHAVRFKMASPVWWKIPFIAVGVFLGFLWVVALAEEFVFRGFLQQLLARAWNSNLAALIVASLLFGAVHLPFGHRFPNWPWVAVATVLGLFCGIAYWRAGSMRASMVTHALVVATWRTFFTG